MRGQNAFQAQNAVVRPNVNNGGNIGNNAIVPGNLDVGNERAQIELGNLVVAMSGTTSAAKLPISKEGTWVEATSLQILAATWVQGTAFQICSNSRE